MKLAMTLAVLVLSSGAFAQTMGASTPISATTANGMSGGYGSGSGAYGTAGETRSQTGVNSQTGTMPSQGPSVNAVNGASASLPSNQPVQGSMSGTSVPADAAANSSAASTGAAGSASATDANSATAPRRR